MSSDEETFRRLAVELRILEGTAEALQSRMNLVRAALTKLRVASMTLEGVEREKKNAPLFVPIGGGSYIKAKLGSAKEVVVGIGADVAVERTMKEARANLENRIAELEKTGTSLGQQLNEVIGKIQGHRTELEEVTARLRERERTKGVRKT
ncbi:MAG: prefoldin subunit alpha [Candidatus Bathyarchaeia archaeon]